MLALFDLAGRKGHDVTQSTMRDHIRLIDGKGNLSEEQERRDGVQLCRGAAVSGRAAGSEEQANGESEGPPLGKVAFRTGIP